MIGHCLNETGSIQEKGVEIEQFGMSQGECLRKCEKFPNATGCEHESGKRECRIHTLPVKVGHFKGHHNEPFCITFGR